MDDRDDATQKSSSSGCLKALGIGCGALAVLLILAVFAGVTWWKNNGEKLVGGARAAAEAGAAFGATTDQAGCFAEARTRITGALDLRGVMSTSAFLNGCLEASAQTPGFCEGVPPSTALRESIRWQAATCGEDEACRALSGVVQQYCTGGRGEESAGVDEPL